MAKHAQIFVPQTGTIYPSAAAAASALGVDASNIGKVIRGSRKSAGGYNFVPVDPGIAPATLRDITEALDTSLSEKQKARQSKRREAGFKRLSKEEQAASRARARATNRAAKELSRSLVEANKLLKEYQKRGLDAISGVVPELEALKGIIGKNKRGGFQASQKELKKFSQEQLEALKRRIDKQLNRKNFRNLEEAEKKKAAVAYQLGVSTEELDNYADLLPTLWHVLQLARQIEGMGSDDVYQEIMDAMQSGADPEELKAILQEIESEYKDQIKMIEDKEPDEMADEIQSGKDAMQPYFDRIDKLVEDARAEQAELEEIEEDIENTENTNQDPTKEKKGNWLDGWIKIL